MREIKNPELWLCGSLWWAARYDGLCFVVGKEGGYWEECGFPFGLEQKSEQEQYHQHKSQAMHHFCQEEIFCIAVFVILEGRTGYHVVGEGVGVLYDNTVVGDVVVPV